MSRECSRLIGCPFFQKFSHLDAEEIYRLKRLFCKGPYMDQCMRKLYKELHGVDAVVDMSPEGKILAFDAFQEDSETVADEQWPVCSYPR